WVGISVVAAPGIAGAPVSDRQPAGARPGEGGAGELAIVGEATCHWQRLAAGETHTRVMDKERASNWVSYAGTATEAPVEAAEAAVKAATTSASPTACIRVGRR